jgi:curli biogenesis system outer membrane secretion channel CsgG
MTWMNRIRQNWKEGGLHMTRGALTVVIFIFLGVSFIFHQSGSCAESVSSYKHIAVFTFKNSSGNSSYKIEDAVTDMFIAELTKNALFRIVERERLKEVVEELKLSLTGMVDPETTIKVQKLVGARYLVFGTITRCGYEQKQQSLIIDSASHKTTVELVARVVDAESGQTIGGAEGFGEARRGATKFDPQALGLQIKLDDKRMKAVGGGTTALEQSGMVVEAAYEAVKRLSMQMNDVFPVEGYIIEVNGNEVMIDLNKELVSSTMSFEVIRMGEEIYHPITKKRLGQKMEKIGDIVVTEPGDNFSYGKVVRGADSILAGDKVRLQRK